MKKILIWLTILILPLTITACSKGSKTNTFPKNSKIKVMASFNPMRELVQAVGGEKVEVHTIIPDKGHAHHYEPKASDLIKLKNADIFVYNGLGMESWVNKALSVTQNKNLIEVDASKDCDPIYVEDSHPDPHLWISPKGAQLQAKNIKEALISASPTDKDYFEENYNNFYNKIEELYTQYFEKINTLQNKRFVTSHAAFGYLCRDLSLEQNSVEDVFASGEPSAKKLSELVEYCKEYNIKTIFVEEAVNPKVAQTLANEVNAKTQLIYTMASKSDNMDYIKSMEYNLKTIYESLKD